MKKILISLSLFIILFLILTNTVKAVDEPVCIVYFYGEGCPHCANVKPVLDDLEKRYANQIEIRRFEVYHNLENYQLYNKFCGIRNIPLEQRGVPLVAVGNQYYMGDKPIIDNLEGKIKEMLETGERTCPLEGDLGCHPANITTKDKDPLIPGLKEEITLPLIIGAGLIDGINPCAFAVLIFFLAFLLGISASKKRMIKAGSVYIIAVYVTYFLAGLGLLTVIQVSGFSGVIVKIAAVLAIIFGLINIKDYFWYGKGFSLQIPESKKPVIERWINKGNISAAIVLGFLVSMFELPCTGGVYLAILAMLANYTTKAVAISYLLLYNIMFVLPLFIILILVTFGMKTEHIESWRTAKKNWMKLVLGVLLLFLGIYLLV